MSTPPKTCIYTVILNNYDTPNPINVNYPCFMFTDDPELKCDGWETIVVKKTNNPIKQQRDIKIRPHHYLPEYDRTVYIDGNMSVNKNHFGRVISAFLGDFLAIKHPNRKTIRQEAIRVLEINKDSIDVVGNQMIHYGRDVNKTQLFATGFMIRRKTPMVVELCDKWAEEVKKHSHRDQLSLPYVASRSKVNITQIPWVSFTRLVKIHKHKIPDDLKIFYSTPFRRDKNIGRANNEFIELLPNDAWVCITDADAMFLQPDFGTHIEDIIKNNPDYGLIGCTVNRLGGLHQCYKGQFSEEMDMRRHYDISVKLREQFGNEVEDTSGVAGVCLIFSKDTWTRAKGFVDGYKCDTNFNKKVRSLGLKIGLAKGLYMMHGYRIENKTHKEAWRDIKHLV